MTDDHRSDFSRWHDKAAGHGACLPLCEQSVAWALSNALSALNWTKTLLREERAAHDGTNSMLRAYEREREERVAPSVRDLQDALAREKRDRERAERMLAEARAVLG